MEGFCRGCLIKFDEPMELLQYTEKNRRLFVYSTGLQVKRNDAFTFQLCRDCFLNMKQACKFKKNCRNSDKRFRNYVALKDVGDPVDFCTFLKNSDDNTFRFPMTSGNSTPATQKCRDDDNESTCTSIRNFMTDILQGEEMPDTEARIIKEVIEEEADVLDDSLDSHWLQDDMSIDTDFRLDFSFSPFSTPHSVNNDCCYTPKQKLEEITFNTVNTEKQTKILADFTNAFKTNENIEELSIFVGNGSTIEKTECSENLKELSPFGIDEIDGMGKSEIDPLKNKQHLKELVSKFDIDEIEGMETSDSQIVESNQNLKELCEFGLEKIDSNNETENNALVTNQNVKELSNFGADAVDSIEYTESNAVKSNKSLKELISIVDIEEIERNGKSETNAIKSNQNELISHYGLGAIGKSDSNNLKSTQNLKELCDFSLDGFNGEEKAERKTHNKVQSLKELCDFSLDSIGSFEKPASNINKNNESLKELYNLSLNSFDDTTKSGSNCFKTDQNMKELDLSLTDFEDMANSGSNTFKTDSNVKEMCDLGINTTEKLESNLDLPSLPDVLERDKMDTPDFEIPKGVIGPMHSSNDISNSSMNIEAFLEDKPCTIDTNLDEALKNSDNQLFSLEDILVSPQVFPAESAASTPTIRNILFGEKLDTTETHIKMEQCIEFPAKSAASTPTITNILFGDKLDTTDTNTKTEQCIEFPAASAVSTPTITNILFGDKLDTTDTNTKTEQCIEFPAASAVSTPTITNILFGDKLDTTDTNTKTEQCIEFPAASAASTLSITNILFGMIDTNSNMEQYIEPYHDIQGDIEIFEEFFQNDTKEFDIEDILRENRVFTSGDWKKPIAAKENESKNIDMDVFTDDTAVTESKKEELKYISHTVSNDTFNMIHFYCKLCKIRYDTSRALSTHLTKFHKVKIVKPKTRYCNKPKPKIEEIINMSEIPPNDKYDMDIFYCKLCDRKYDTSRALSVHFSKTHNITIQKPKLAKSRNCGVNDTPGTKSSNQAILNILDKSPEDIFDIEKSYCKLCKKKYNGGRALSIHMSKIHDIKIVKPEYNRKNRIAQLCNNCGKKYGDSTNFARHVKVCKLKTEAKAQIFKCDYCLQEFKTNFILQKHKITHTNEQRKKPTGKEVVCTHCGAVLRGQSNYALHMRRHTKDYSVTCEYCNKGFYRQSDLTPHLRTHTGDTPFSCTYCPKLFARRDVLLRHILTHLGKKFYECDYCGLKFIKKCDLKKHMQNASCRKVNKDKKKKNTCKIEDMGPDIPEKQEEERVDVENEVTKIKTARNKNKTGKKEDMDIDIAEEQEEKIEVPKPKVTVVYAKGSDATIRKQLSFLIEPIPQEQEKVEVEVQKEVRKVIKAKKKTKTDKKEIMDIDIAEEKVEVPKPKVTVTYAKGSDATIRKQLLFLKTETIPQKPEVEVEIQKEVRKVIKAKTKNETDKNEIMDIDITEEQERKVVVPKPKVTVTYAKGSNATIRKQSSFLKTETIPQVQEKARVEVQKEVSKVTKAKRKNKTDKKESQDIDIIEEKVEVEVQKQKVIVVNEKRSDTTIRKQFLKTKEEKVEVKKEVEAQKVNVTVIYAKSSDAKNRHQLPFLETDLSN